MGLREEDFVRQSSMIFSKDCSKDCWDIGTPIVMMDDGRLEHHCQQCGQVLDLYLRVPYDQYGLYMCSEECFSSFAMLGRLDYWIRLIGRSKNGEGRRSYVAT